MLMGIIKWDREVSLEQAKSGEKLPDIIRGYDEPDTNLHYEAQRHMFQAISDVVKTENSQVQAILCTRSLAMIDRAPAQDIRLLTISSKGYTTLTQLQIHQDPEIEHFLRHLARGLRHSQFLALLRAMFCFGGGRDRRKCLACPLPPHLRA